MCTRESANAVREKCAGSAMCEGDIAAQNDELLVLESVLEADEFTLLTDRSSPAGVIRLRLVPSLHINCGSVIARCFGPKSETADNYEETCLDHISPAILTVELPAQYPSLVVPKARVSSTSICSAQCNELEHALQSKFTPGEPVLFDWFGWLQAEAVDHLVSKFGFIQLSEETSTREAQDFADEMRREIFNKEVQTCAICFDEVPGAKMGVLRCNHHFCKECLLAFFECHMRDNTIHKLVCPVPDCKTCIDFNVVEKVMGQAGAARFEELQLEYLVRTGQGLCSCPRCDAICEKPDGQRDDDSNEYPGSQVVQCPKCLHAFCPECFGPYHPGQGCTMGLEDQLEHLTKKQSEARKHAAQLAKRGEGLTVAERKKRRRAAELEFRNALKEFNIRTREIVSIQKAEAKIEQSILRAFELYKGAPTAPGETCYDGEIKALRELQSFGIVRCPRCKSFGQKTEGCNKVFCTCGASYCNKCGQDITKESYSHFVSGTCSDRLYAKNRTEEIESRKSAVNYSGREQAELIERVRQIKDQLLHVKDPLQAVDSDSLDSSMALSEEKSLKIPRKNFCINCKTDNSQLMSRGVRMNRVKCATCLVTYCYICRMRVHKGDKHFAGSIGLANSKKCPMHSSITTVSKSSSSEKLD